MTVRTRRPPPPFRRLVVARKVQLSPRMTRVTLAGDELDGLVVGDPASSVRVLLPSPGTDEHELVIPEWTGNEFLLPGGRRPAIRTLTPRRVDATALEIDLDIVIHEHGVASDWATRAETGWPAAVSGPARGYSAMGTSFVLLGDETAIPAMGQLLEVIAPEARVRAHVEIASSSAYQSLAREVEWHELATAAPPGDTLVAAILATDLADSDRVWAAGEAAGMQRIRRHLFEERGWSRSQATVRGYWKHGRTADAGDVDD